ncbi:acyl-coenzyme A oxidase 1-like [Chironomus tepperi]|uniref:acyl-coenzyme A oxidase 1-like n=1 Tax=Chironomus tepperi TaxID=113505 RepID=UPI00391EF01D
MSKNISNVNKDLKEERDKVNFNVEEFTNWFYGGADKVKEKRYIENYFLSDKDLNLELDTSYLSYKDKYEEAVRRSVVVYKKLYKLHAEMGGNQEDFVKIMENLRYTMGAINAEGNPFALHFSMFALTILNMTNDEQKAEWLPRIFNCNILGTYAQTELGHGTYIQRLETTATYDPKTKEFTLNSPTLTSYKWWPGNLGHTVNHAVVMAQLYSQGKCHGIQPFFVQLRDTETHKPLPGIDIGDIGNKVGFQTVNNGFLGFKNVKIPYKNMLMKNSKLLEDGTFVKPKNPKLNYGTMVIIRVHLVIEAAFRIAKATTIALRYSMVRRQSPINPNEIEPKIIEHVTQQNKIFPGIAKAIIFKCMADYLTKLHVSITQEGNAGNLARLPELHALSCCLKAVCTNEDAKNVEMCRLSCGGHGFLRSAGLDDVYRNSTAAQTYEGENTVMLLQASRFLIKSFNEARNGGSLTEGVKYLNDFIRRNGKREVFDNSLNGILRAVQAAAAGRTHIAWKLIEEGKRHNTVEVATNLAGVRLTKAAELHGYVCLLQVGIEEIDKIIRNVSPALGLVFKNVLELFAVDLILSKIGDVVQHVDISMEDIEKLEKQLETLFQFFRTSAIGLADGFDFSDAVIDSTLGSYDGNVYENLFKAARKSPLNQEDVNRSYHLYIKPLMKSNL